MEKQTARLESWIIMNQSVYGTVYGHPLLSDGSEIRTSSIVKLNLEGKTCETLNTNYTLGAPLELK